MQIIVRCKYTCVSCVQVQIILVKISNTVEVFLSISKFFKQETELEPDTRNVFSISMKIKNWEF